MVHGGLFDGLAGEREGEKRSQVDDRDAGDRCHADKVLIRCALRGPGSVWRARREARGTQLSYRILSYLAGSKHCERHGEHLTVLSSQGLG